MVSESQITACVRIARKYGARRVLLFGSAATDPAHARDIDLICDGVDGFDLYRMGGEMETATQVAVDIFPARPLTPFMELAIEDSRTLYESEQTTT